MKKLTALLLSIALLASLAGCAGTTVVVGNCTCPPESHEPVETPTAAPEQPVAPEQPAISTDGALKTGLAIVPSLSKSAAATAEANGKAEFDVTVVAITVDEKGVIHSCIIDSVGASAEFTAEGVPAAVGTTEVKSKNQLGFDYGMVAYNASPIGKEWFEQAAALAKFAEGKTVEEVKGGIAGGYASDVDLATSATIYLGGYVAAIEAAVNNAKVLGAQTGDALKLGITAKVNTAAEEAGGSAELTLDAAVLTLNGETITSCTIDSLQAKVAFDGTGALTTDISVAPKTKTQLGFDYGMVAYHASPIGKEWFEQVENFCAYVTGKTLAEVAGIAVTETTAPAEADLAAGTTIAIGGFQALIASAAG